MIRLICTLLLGLILTYMSYQFKYASDIFSVVAFAILAIFSFCCWIGFMLYESLKDKKRLPTLIGGISFILIILSTSWKINSTFDKPTLLNVFYDGDFNGTSIDFKKDGTYIFNNFAIGFNEYTYGTYKINGDTILLDRTKIDNVIKSNRLLIFPKKIEMTDSFRIETYVSQLEKYETIAETEFRVTKDNRKSTSK